VVGDQICVGEEYGKKQYWSAPIKLLTPLADYHGEVVVWRAVMENGAVYDLLVVI
jgi:hypothetical protein